LITTDGPEARVAPGGPPPRARPDEHGSTVTLVEGSVHGVGGMQKPKEAPLPISVTNWGLKFVDGDVADSMLLHSWAMN